MSTKVGSLEIELAANIARLQTDFNAAKSEVSKSVGEMQRMVGKMQAEMEASMGKVGNAVNMVGKAFAAVAVIAAGGEMFGKAIDESNKLTGEAMKLGKQLGITATEASVLNVALGDVYVETDTMLAANQKLTKTLGTNEGAFKNLGVATRDSNGNFRSSLDVMLDTNSALLKFKEGVDRNIEGQKIYGKQWGEVQGILKLTTDKMEDARKKSAELGLVVGQENVAATVAYKAAMNDIGDVMSAMKKAVGDALLPILTDLANWFSDIGPQAVLVMKGAIGVLCAAFYGIKMVVEIAWETIKFFIRTAITNFLTLAEVASKALTFDFAGAKAAWKNGTQMIQDDFATAMDNIAAKAQANRDKMANLFSAPTATVKKEGGISSEGAAEKGSEKSQMPEWKAALEAKKKQNNEFFKTSLADDEAYWQEKLNHVIKGGKDWNAINHEIFGIQKQLAQQKFAAEMESLKDEYAAAHAGSEERIALAAQAAQRVGDTYGFESQQYLAAIKEIKKAADEWDKEQQKLDVMKVERSRDHALAQMGMERDQLALMKSLGQISDQEEIAALQQLENRKYQLEVQAQKDKIAISKEEGSAKQAQLDELAKMEDKHNAEMAKLDGQRVLAVKKEWGTMLSGFSGAFEQSLNGMMQGTQTFQKAMANMGLAIQAEFLKMGVKRVTTWVANEAAMLMASKGKESAVSALNTTGTVKAITSKATEATTVVGANAAEGAAGAAASQAAIPVVGPGLAIGAFATTMAMILGAKSLIHSSAGGEWQVPNDRLNLVHKNETILPAHIAGPLRDMVANGGSMGGGHTINITATDTQDVLRSLQKGGALHKALTELNRNFAR